MKYRPEVDGLRALAVLPVVFFHAGFESFGGGFVGVDVFFVISGYLITSILSQELDAGRYSLVNFYERRARRILPALFTVLLVCLPLAWIWLPPSDFVEYSDSVVGVSLFVSNFLFWSKSGYFDTSAELQPLLHTWSLAVEEQFYLFFPPILFLLWRIGRQRVAIVIGLGGVASLLLAEYGVQRWWQSASFYLLPARAWELATGSLIAFYLSGGADRRLPPLCNQLLAGIGIAAIAASIVLYDRNTPFPGIAAALPVFGTALVILFAWPGTLIGNLLAARLPVSIGLISYSTYLWHQPLFAFARHASEGAPGKLLLLALCAMSVLLAYLSWRYVEHPFRRKGTFGRRSIFWMSGVASLFFLCIGVIGHLFEGFPGLRVAPAAQKVLSAIAVSPERSRCHSEPQRALVPGQACHYFGDNASWAVLGDSHGVELAHELAVRLKPEGIGLQHYTFSGCRPSYGSDATDQECTQWLRQAVDHLAEDAGIRTVVVAFRIHAGLFGLHDDVYPGLPDSVEPEKRESVWRSLVALLSRLEAAGKQVVYVMQAPELPDSIQELIFHARDPRTVKGVSRDWWTQRTAFVDQRISQIPDGILIVNPADRFCDQRQCYAVIDGDPLYFDNHHPSLLGAGRIAQEVIRLALPNPSATPAERADDG
ncbi:MAG: acyltransferase [Pseudomonadales bacterium]|nr:acyltransferase [Pseudomonadales bacterium]